MSQLTNIFSAIASAIRTKTNLTNTITPVNMANVISTLPPPYTPPTTIYNLYAPPSGITDVSQSVDLSNYFANDTNTPTQYPTLYLSANVTNTCNMFRNSTFNGNVVMLGGVDNACNMFANCTQFNCPVEFKEGTTNIMNAFLNCTAMSAPVVLPDSILNMVSAFRSSNISTISALPSQVTSLNYTFMNTPFNQPLNIPSSVIYCQFAFANTPFNQPIRFPASVKDCQFAFSNSAFNQDLDLSALSADVNFSGIISGSLFNGNVLFNNSHTSLVLDNFFDRLSQYRNRTFIAPSSVVRANSIARRLSDCVFDFRNCENLSSVHHAFDGSSNMNVLFASLPHYCYDIAHNSSNFSISFPTTSEFTNNLDFANAFNNSDNCTAPIFTSSSLIWGAKTNDMLSGATNIKLGNLTRDLYLGSGDMGNNFNYNTFGLRNGFNNPEWFYNSGIRNIHLPPVYGNRISINVNNVFFDPTRSVELHLNRPTLNIYLHGAGVYPYIWGNFQLFNMTGYTNSGITNDMPCNRWNLFAYAPEAAVLPQNAWKVMTGGGFPTSTTINDKANGCWFRVNTKFNCVQFGTNNIEIFNNWVNGIWTCIPDNIQ